MTSTWKAALTLLAVATGAGSGTVEAALRGALPLGPREEPEPMVDGDVTAAALVTIRAFQRRCTSWFGTPSSE